MGDLIDDLLNLAKLTRTEVKPARVDLGDLSRTVVSELRKTQPDRIVDVQIASGLETTGDPRMLRIALENLLGNAWKFTQKQSAARIEVGTTHTSDGDRCYFVRDNGAGFSMAYAHKLFGAFQRLHPETEYEGTGIGLATVARIIHRHGGRIWAESAPSKGATFFFTLKEKL
jgi:light-regulated signal transduction histidine kinase (bacteriophytochrome)